MLPHYKKEHRYPRLPCWIIAVLAGAAMWALLVLALQAVGECVLRNVC